MTITAEIFQAFLLCETKAYQKSSGLAAVPHEYSEWQRRSLASYKTSVALRLRASCHEDEYLVGVSFSNLPTKSQHRLLLDCSVESKELRSCIHALECSSSTQKTKFSPFIPVRFGPTEKITPHDKLMLAFDALVLALASGKTPAFGKIIHGANQRSIKVQLPILLKMARAVVDRITDQQASKTPPPLILNRHCGECEFQSHCRHIAQEKDELSLLANMTETERKKHHSKGIFTVTQLSYTFRPRRKPKKFAGKREKYHHSLKALAIRENKIHIVGKPELKITGTPIYLDVEGIPDRDFYYLIGLRVKSGEEHVQHSFWANDPSEEQAIWTAFLKVLVSVENPQLIHYGSYETTFLKRMKERYGGLGEGAYDSDKFITQAINILAVTYAQVYFPTYSNGLKEIARNLGFQWSDSTISGLNSLKRRQEWEDIADDCLKQNLVIYNAEDCAALEIVTLAVSNLCRRDIDATQQSGNETVYTDTMKPESLFKFGKAEFVLPEMEYINRCAYWDYQRDNIYVRSSRRLQRVSKTRNNRTAKPLAIDKIVKCLPPACCPQCKATTFHAREGRSKIVYDLKFSQNGVKKWVVKYLFSRYACQGCGHTFYSDQKNWARSKFGLNFLAYCMYLLIELRLSLTCVARNLNQLFGFNYSFDVIAKQKERASTLYQDTYQGILKKLANGKLVHADETRVSIDGGDSYVWVFTNLEEVAYVYTKTREGDMLESFLKDFSGVLVSDFYPVYDAINCPQQKCLIHLMRDLNDDLRSEPFNQELKELARAFAHVLKPIIETIDRFGLKSCFLQKHKVFVERFYTQLARTEYRSETAIQNKKRFIKNREKLFTFLSYDGVPWNNNNAEHAIKAFAWIRKVIGGNSSDIGIHEYLTLLSISATCKSKGADFLAFMRSGEKDIDKFIRKHSRVSSQNLTDES